MKNLSFEIYKKEAFSLVELSVVLVIIGLLVGGVLVGRDLIATSEIRSQIKQIEEFNAAANTFKLKYDYLPGDIVDPDATRLGLHARLNCAGFGNGNGLIEGVSNSNAGCNGVILGARAFNGEAMLFWQDLARVRLIKEDVTNQGYGYWDTSGTSPEAFFPKANIGNGNVITTWSGGSGQFGITNSDGKNYLSISNLMCNNYGCITPSVGMSVSQAYSIDSKIDDGLPQLGNVLAYYGNGYAAGWAAGGGNYGASGTTCCYAAPDFNAPTTVATPYAATNCYDNNGVSGDQLYSTKFNNNAINCAISIRAGF